MTVLMRFLGSNLILSGRRDVIELVREHSDPLTPIVSVSAPALPGASATSVAVAPYASFERPRHVRGERVFARRSKNPDYTFAGTRWANEGRTVVDFPSIQSALTWDAAGSRSCTAYLSEASGVWFRYLLLELFVRMEEYAGVVQLHATAASTDSGCIAIPGNKGAGKSTILLELLAHGFDHVAPDRTFLLPTSAGLAAAGWPEEFNLGLGTIRRHPVIAADVAASNSELDRLSSEHKLRIPVSRLAALLGFAIAESPRPLVGFLLPSERIVEPRWATASEVVAAVNCNSVVSSDYVDASWQDVVVALPRTDVDGRTGALREQAAQLPGLLVPSAGRVNGAVVDAANELLHRRIRRTAAEKIAGDGPRSNPRDDVAGRD